jgi:hypothetical protein
MSLHKPGRTDDRLLSSVGSRVPSRTDDRLLSSVGTHLPFEASTDDEKRSSVLPPDRLVLSDYPEVDVLEAEYHRLLGYPRGAVLSQRAQELAAWARAWFAAHGQPWVYAREAGQLEVAEGVVRLDGAAFHSRRLRELIERAEACGAVLVAASAGGALEAEAQRLWREEKPDEYFFLEVLGSAVVERLITMAGARLCSWADSRGLAVLPHDSPGYPDWDIGEQAQLLDLLRQGGKQPLPGGLEALDSGALRPKKSQLAVFGVTSHVDRVRRLTELSPCENCSYMPCQFRRAPYVRGAGAAPIETVRFVTFRGAYAYSTNRKALRRWAAERLTISRRDDGTSCARFRYQGTTCTNMGRSLEFDYHVSLGRRDEGYPILETRCSPAPGDTGHTFMCRYDAGGQLLAAVDSDKPLLGRPLHEVLAWQRPPNPAGCYCEESSRHHKWGLVLETLHYALFGHESPEGQTREPR